MTKMNYMFDRATISDHNFNDRQFGNEYKQHVCRI